MTTIKPTILVIFGATGDLTARKLIPALFNLCLDKQLPEKFSILGVGRQSWDQKVFRNHLLEGVDKFSRRGKADEETWNHFSEFFNYLVLDFMVAGSYTKLSEELKIQDKKWDEEANFIFYLATTPSAIEVIVNFLGNAKLLADKLRSRIVIEKPFGRDLNSALHLNETLAVVCDESQIFRIDHYLGKETVQNILALRFANSLFEPLWNRTYIDNIQITVGEQIGVEHRGKYYESAGALRDMLENHLFQLLALVAMESPTSFEQEEIRNKKVDVLHAIRPMPKNLVANMAVRGQYGSGDLTDGSVPKYRSEIDVSTDSVTETFAALKIYIDNWRWQEVPFYLRTGKRLPTQIAEISIQFCDVPHRSFPESATETWMPNHLIIQIQPEEKITLFFQAKMPGTSFKLKPVEMKFSYKDSFCKDSPEAYETLLLDIFTGDATSFVRADFEKAAWTVVSPILEEWESVRPSDFPNYPAGTWGPKSSDELLKRDGKKWISHDKNLCQC